MKSDKFRNKPFLSRHFNYVLNFSKMIRACETFLVHGKYVSIYVDPSSNSSGVRFWHSFAKYSKQKYKASLVKRKPEVVFCNINVSPIYLLLLKASSIKIILRVDGLYYERPTFAYWKSFNIIKRTFYAIFFLIQRLGFDNYTKIYPRFILNFPAFLKIKLSDYVIYQSNFSRSMYNQILDVSKSTVIINGVLSPDQNQLMIKPKEPLTLCTVVASGKRVTKRVSEIVKFILWASKKRTIRLVLLGLDIEKPPTELIDLMPIIKNKNDIFSYIPEFDLVNYSHEYEASVKKSHVYITFAQRDPCPNAVIEAISFGLPVLCLDSGGLKEIVGDAGILLPFNDFQNGFYSSHIDSSSYDNIDFEEAYNQLSKLENQYADFTEKAKKAMSDRLSLELVADSYLSVVHSV